MTYYKAPTSNYWSSTLNGTINDSVDTITLQSTTGLQAPGVVVIDREDGNGTATPNSREVVSYTAIAGNDLTGCTRAFSNSTARSHNSGALVEAVFDVTTWNDLRDAAATALSTDGTGLTVSNATISAIAHSARYVGSSIASISRIELKDLALSSSASIRAGSFNSSTAVYMSTSTIVEKDSAAGVNIDGVTIKDGYTVVGEAGIVAAAQNISDDSVYSFTPSSQRGIAFFSVTTAGTPHGIVAYRVGTAVCVSMLSSANFAVTTGALAGTTGSDGNITVSTHTDGKIYIENRTGGEKSIMVYTIGYGV